MTSSIFSHFRLPLSLRLQLSIALIVLSGLFCPLLFAKEASAAAPAGLDFNTVDRGYSHICAARAGGAWSMCTQFNGGVSVVNSTTLAYNFSNFFAQDGASPANPLPIFGLGVFVYDPGSIIKATQYNIAFQSVNENIQFVNAVSSFSRTGHGFTITATRVAWTQNYIEYQVQISPTHSYNNAIFALDGVTGVADEILGLKSACANPSRCDETVDTVLSDSQIAPAGTSNTGVAKNQPLIGQTRDQQLDTASNSVANTDINGGDYTATLPTAISSSTGTLANLATTLMTNSSSDCTFADNVPLVYNAVPQNGIFNSVLTANFCPYVDFSNSFLTALRVVSQVVVAFVFVLIIWRFGEWLFDETKSWGTPQDGGSA